MTYRPKPRHWRRKVFAALAPKSFTVQEGLRELEARVIALEAKIATLEGDT